MKLGFVALDFECSAACLTLLGLGEFGRSGWAAGQDDGTQKSKSTQSRSQLTWDTQ